MALSTKWTRAQLRSAVRRELMDPREQWWSNEELNNYIAHWQDRIQDDLELVKTTATVTTSTATLTLTDVATNILRVDAVYWDGDRLSYRQKEDLDLLDRDWRDATTATPYVFYQDNDQSISFYPPPATAGTVVFEHPKLLTFAADTSTMDLPAWTKYSCINFCAWKAYSRFGPNQDIDRAMRRKAKFDRQLRRYRTIMANFFPQRFPVLAPSGEYEKRITEPNPPNETIY